MASDDRFETLLRETLRDEAVGLPVVVTAAELRARAGRRRGVGSLSMKTPAFFVGATSTAAVVAIALFVALTQRGPGPAASSTLVPVPSASQAPSGGPNQLASPTPAPSPQAMALTPRAVITRSFGPKLRILSTVPGSPSTILYSRDQILYPIDHLSDQEDGMAVSNTGLLALLIDEEGSLGTRFKTAIMPMNGPLADPVVVPGRGAVFAPDGSLITFGNGVPTIIYRTTGLPDSPSTVEITPAQLIAVDGTGLVPLADGSGLATDRVIVHAATENELIPSTLLWDGTVVDRDPSMALSDDGLSLRRSGANGETIGGGCDTTGGAGGGCTTTWKSADGTEVPLILPNGVSIGIPAWTPDGSTVLFTSGPGIYAIRASDRKVTKIASDASQPGRILDIADGLILIENGDDIDVVGLDGTVNRAAIPGTFIQRVP